MVLITCNVQWSVTDARHCVQLHPKLCTTELDLPGMGSDSNNEWYGVSTPVNLQIILLCWDVTNWYMFGMKKILQVSSNKL